MIELDASYGEGGGQLVRMAVGLAAMTGTAVRLANVRARREPPGLAPQHLAAVRTVAGLCGAKTDGLELRANAFSFAPQKRPAGGEVRVDVGTAGSITLVLQALLPVLFAATGPSRAVVIGGTDVRHSPSWDYFSEVLLHHVSQMKLGVRSRLVRRGYYPRGGGEVLVEVEPGVPSALDLTSAPTHWEVRGRAHVSKLPLDIAERMTRAAEETVAQPCSISMAETSAIGPGGAITLWAESEAGRLGASRVAERGVRAETLGKAVGAELALELASGATLDEHAADQLLVFLAMANGASSFLVREVSSHARTAMWLLEQFLPVEFAAVQEASLWRVTIAPRPGGETGRRKGLKIPRP